MFRKDADAYGESLKRQCKAFGLNGHWPIGNPPVGMISPIALARSFYRANVHALDRCEAVIAEISPFRGPNADPGTAFEIGYAIAHGTPVFAWSNDLRSLVDRTMSTIGGETNGEEFRDFEGNLIENFGLPENLMIACPVKSISKSFHDALLATASDLMSGNVRRVG